MKREFIKSGAFDQDMSKTLHCAFELRQKGNYLEQPDVKKEDIDEIFPKVVDFVKKTRQFLLDRK